MDYNKQHFVCDQNTRIVILGFWLDYINNSFKVTERLFSIKKREIDLCRHSNLKKTLRKTTINPKFKPNHCKNKRLIFSCSIFKKMVVIGKQYTDSHGH